jgi:hypothetical protein
MDRSKLSYLPRSPTTQYPIAINKAHATLNVPKPGSISPADILLIGNSLTYPIFFKSRKLGRLNRSYSPSGFFPKNEKTSKKKGPFFFGVPSPVPKNAVKFGDIYIELQ